MKNIFKNNLFTNPVEWTKGIVGTHFRYRCIQIATVILGAMLFLLFTAVSKRRDFTAYFGMAMSIGAVAVVFPLYYLKALRGVYLEFMQSKNKQPDK